MADLRKMDSERLLSFVGDAHSVDGSEPFTTELLDRLAETLQSEFAMYMEFDPRAPGAHPRLTLHCSQARHYESPSWPHRRGEVPVFAVRPAGDVFFWSDDWERAARWEFEPTPWAKAWDVVDCAYVTLPADRSARGTVALHRQSRDFTERDRAAFAALGPHVRAMIRNAHARRKLADLTAVADAADEGSSRGYVLLRGGLEVEHASPAARRILASWFDEPATRLPALLEEWLRSDKRGGPFVFERNGRRLVVQAATARALVLAEERVIPASLTAREREVLRLLAAGKSTGEIAAELWVTPATVSKHLHHIYRKLDVTSRTAALAVVGAHQP